MPLPFMSISPIISPQLDKLPNLSHWYETVPLFSSNTHLQMVEGPMQSRRRKQHTVRVATRDTLHEATECEKS